MSDRRLFVVRMLAILVVSFGLIYIYWRWTQTIAWDHWWVSVPLVLAETYSLGESVLYSFTMWNARQRPAPPRPAPGQTVDVFITTYNEPLDLVLKTSLAARDMTYPHRTWILDDGDRGEFRAAARQIGVGYIVRGPEWEGRPRHAKAGNLNNALARTSGDFVMILDADQVPGRRFLDRVLGYFDDPEVALVQTPQYFWNVPRSDPLGSQAELFYGPIQQGKDGWDAAFFCGSNAVLRREALMSLGLSRYSRTAAERTRGALHRGVSRLQDLRDQMSSREPASLPAVEAAIEALRQADRQLRHGAILADLTYGLRTALQDIATQAPGQGRALVTEVDAIIEQVDVSRTDQAVAIQPMDTSSITEDMATAMHLHAMGWRSVYHHEVLVQGLAPEDLATMLSQRQRWASGSMQVFFKDNPLFVPGLTLPQRLMYLATMTSYLNGFAALAYIAAPVVFLLFGVFPLSADPIAFFTLFLPFFVSCQLLFQVAGKGSGGLWRGQQMSFALFPTWISATVAGAAATWFGIRLSFKVTSKTKEAAGPGYRYVRSQLLVMVLLLIASAVGILRVVADIAPLWATVITLGWVIVDLLLLGVVIGAARYRGPGPDIVEPIRYDPRELADALQVADAAAPATDPTMTDVIGPGPSTLPVRS